MKSALFTAALFVIPAAAAAQQPLEIGSLAAGAARAVAELKTDDIKGQPMRLAWSLDGSELYLQTVEGDPGRPGAKVRHYVLSAATGQRKSADEEPAWAKVTWTAKSDRSSPDVPAFMINVTTEKRTERTTAAPMGGDMARGGMGSSGGSGASDADLANAANTGQTVNVYSMVLGGQTIGEFVNTAIVPGMTFGWGPRGSRAIVYAEPKNGRLVVMDVTGKTQELKDTKDALLPAFSPDGTQIAWLRRDGRKKFILQIAAID